MNVWIDGMTVKVESRTADVTLNQLKKIDGGRFDDKKNCWSFPLEKYDALVELRNQYNGQIALKPVQINSNALSYMETYLKDIGYSISTIQNYKRHLGTFLKYAGGRTDDECIQHYLSYLKEERHSSVVYCRGAKKAIELHLKLEARRLGRDEIM